MSGSVNKVIIVGNLGGDPEVKADTNGRKYARLSVATSETWRDKNTGERKERVEWHRVVIWSEGLVGVAEQYLKKGAKVYIEGALQTTKFQDRETGKDRYSTDIVVNGFKATLVMLSGSGRPDPAHPDDEAQTRTFGEMSANRRSVPAGGRNGDMNDDIPF